MHWWMTTMRCIYLGGGTEATCALRGVPVWERAYAVTKIKRCVEGAAGTRGADKVIAEDALLRTYGLHSYRPL